MIAAVITKESNWIETIEAPALTSRVYKQIRNTISQLSLDPIYGGHRVRAQIFKDDKYLFTMQAVSYTDRYEPSKIYTSLFVRGFLVHTSIMAE